MYTVYVYILDTMADWEIGNITAELHSKRFFKKNAKEIIVKTVSYSKEPIVTMGGLTVIPDITIYDIKNDNIKNDKIKNDSITDNDIYKSSMLILPGADVWNDPRHNAIIDKAMEFLDNDAPVCAICGATVALAKRGILDKRPHTSNGAGFLEMFCDKYAGTEFYVDEPAVSDGNLITASCTGAWMWTKLIIEYLDVYSQETMEAWNNYFSTGKAEHFFALMQSLQN